MKTYSRKNSSYLKKAFVASNFNEMCRLCLSEVDMVLTPIFQDNKISYQEWIQYSVDVLIEEDDGLPSNICEECLAMVEQTYLFKKKCKTSDSKLREHLELVELTEECKLNNIGFNDISDDHKLFQNEQPAENKIDESSAVDSGGTICEPDCENDINKMISEELNEHSKTSFKSDDAKIEEAKDLNLEHQEWLAESQLQQTFHEDQELSEGNQVQGKTPVKKIQRYILKGEKREGDQEEDLTVCEVIPLDVRNDESIQYSSENFDSPKYANLNSYNENDHSPVEESLADVIPNEKSDTRIQEIYKLWDNEEEGEEVNETEKNEEDIVVFNVVWEDNADKIDKKENMGSVEVDLEQNGIVQTHRVYTNKNQIEIVKTMPQTKCFNCFACSEQFPTYSGLKEHLAKVHKDVSDAPYCEVCGKNFTCANSLKRHMAIHTGFKPYKCKICGRKFSQGSILKRHVLTHENLKPFNCHICEKSYTQKTNLLCHLKNHGYPTVAESFSCKLCSKTFVHQSGLSRHIKLHKGVRFLCVHCKKSFGDASALARHVKAVHQQQQSQIIDG